MNPDEAKALISMLEGGYPKERFSARNAQVYEGAIADLDARDTQAAIEAFIKNVPRIPEVVEIRKEVARVGAERLRELSSFAQPGAPRRSGFGEPTAEEWAKVLPGMIDREARFRGMVDRFRRERGLRARQHDPCPFLEMAKRGARGEHVLVKLSDLVGSSGGQG